MDQIELIDKRKPREKHFLQKDGTIRAEVYGTDVHYLKDGKYEEIDNTLIKENDSLVNKSNDYKVEFKENIKDSLMKMSKDDHYIDFKIRDTKDVKLKSNKRQLSKETKNVTYNNITDDITIEYQALSNAVKETIILQNANYSELSFELDTDLNLKEEDGQILALDNKENIVFRIEKPFMVDSNEIRNDNIYYSIQSYCDGYVLRLVLDDEWLTGKERKYPVYIDPTIINDGNNLTSYDTYIYEGDTNYSRGSLEYLKAGVQRVNNTDRINRALMKFDLPEIGTGSEVVAAYLNLMPYVSTSNNQNARTYLVEVHRVTQSWDENTANWQTMNDKYDSRVEAVIDCERGYIEDNVIRSRLVGASIIDLVKKWYRNIPNNGILIKASEEVYVDDDYPAFYSKDNNIYGDNPKPVLVIEYLNQNGIESYLDYKKQAFEMGNTYVNTYNGNMTGIFNLGQTLGGQLPVVLNLIYNTNDVVLNKNTVFGKGFKVNYLQTLKKKNIYNTELLEYEDGDGTLHYFYRNNIEISEENDFYSDEDGLNLKINKVNNEYILSDEKGNKMKFVVSNNVYYLTQIEDINNNTITISYDSNNNITQIEDINNLQVIITYSNNLITITSPNSTTTLTYSNNKLSSITKNNRSTLFTYDSNDVIASITDPTLLKISYEYYDKTPYKMRKVTQYGSDLSEGQSFTLEYGNEITNIVDNKSRNETHVFDTSGKLITFNSLGNSDDIRNAYSYSRQYGNENLTKNKIISSSIPTRYIKNYLKNTSFETSQDSFVVSNQNITKQISNEYQHTGEKSLKVISSANDTSITQQVTLDDDKYYTFSGYFKSNNPFTIALQYTDEHGVVQREEEIVEASNEFIRRDVTIFYEDNADDDFTISIEFNNNTTTYIDDIQLEDGEVANIYNIIENSDFSEGYNDWDISVSRNNQAVTDVTNFFEIVNVNSNNKALKVKMKPDYVTSFKKRFQIKGNENDLYAISFWYKNEGVEGCRQYAGNSVTINYHPVDGEAEYCIVGKELNRDPDRWQFFTYRSRALEDFDYIEIIFNQNTNANNFYITDISFYREETSGDFNYDLNGNLISVKNQSQEETHFTYDQKNQLIKATSSTGSDYRYEYDKNSTNVVLNAIASDGICTENKYNSKGNPIRSRISRKIVNTITDGIYKIRSKGTYEYIKIRNNNIFTEENDCSNTILSFVQVGNYYKIYSSVLSNYHLSYLNNQVILSNSLPEALFSFEKRDDDSYNIAIIDNNNIAGYLKTNNNQIVVDGIIASDTNFDFYVEVATSEFIETSTTYDTDNRFVESVTDSCFNTTSYETNTTTGNVTKITNPKGIITEFLYNSNDDVTKATQNNYEINYLYNSQNNMIEKVSLSNLLYKFQYDDFLNIKKVFINETQELINYNYESNNGNLLSKTFGNNQTISYEYDFFNRLKKKTLSNNIFNYKYDNNGNISKIISNNKKEKYYYDASNRLCRYNEGSYKILYKYDSSNSITKKNYFLQNDNHVIDIAKADDVTISNVTFDNNEVLAYQYDNLGRLKKKTLPNGVKISYTYVSWGRRTSYLIDTMTIGSDVYKYKYDSLNNITDVLLNNTLIEKYYYNDYNELSKEENYVSNESIEYQYSYGNILSKTTKNMNNNIIINTETYEYNDTTWRDKLTKYQNTSITYDNIGNTTSIGNASLSWIGGRLLNSYSDNSSVVNYKYNNSGIRESKIVNNIETNYYLDNERIIYETRGNDIIYYLYDLNEIIGLEYNNQKYYYLKNLQHDIIGILDSNGNKVVNYKYDSWGNVISITDNNNNVITSNTNIGIINPFRYKSYYYDSETNLYYLNKRYYSPLLSRFVNADEIINANRDIVSFNLFTYASNNPINYIDPTGGFIFSIIGIVVKVSVAYFAVKSIIAYEANLFLNAMDYDISRYMFNKSLYSPTDGLPESIKKKIIKQAKPSPQVNNRVTQCVEKHKDSTSFSDCKGEKAELFDDDLLYSIGHVFVNVSGVKKNDKEWDIKVKMEDTYNFDHFDIGLDFATIVNDLGYIMQKLGMVREYKWNVSFDMTYTEK